MAKSDEDQRLAFDKQRIEVSERAKEYARNAGDGLWSGFWGGLGMAAATILVGYLTSRNSSDSEK